MRVAGPDSRGLFVSQPAAAAALDPAALDALAAEPQEWTRLPAGAHTGPWLVATEQLSDGHWLQVGKTTEAHEALLEHFRIVALWVLLLGLALGLLAGYLLAGRALGPIRRLIAAVYRVLATGQMNDRVPLRAGPGDELQELTELFNRMLEKNGALLRGMREALDNVAHDLRTPLTRCAAARNAPSPGRRGQPIAKRFPTRSRKRSASFCCSTRSPIFRKRKRG